MSELSGIASRARLLLDAPGYAQGWQDTVLIPAPAAGAGWSHVVDGQWWERLITANWTLTTDAVVANRFPQLALLDQYGNRVAQVPASGTVVAGATITFHLMQRCPQLAASTAGTAPGWLPDLLVPPGWRWVSTGTGYDAGDQETGALLLVQRFPSDIITLDAIPGG